MVSGDTTGPATGGALQALRADHGQTGRAGLVAPNDLIWIFAFPRSGTTWLASMMGDLPGYEIWDEPYVGALFGEFYHRHNGDHQTRPFILAPHYRSVWLQCLRSLILEGARVRYAQSQPRHLIVKEPHGCIGAELLSEALPESRLILLLRDPRDVIASNLDSQRKGSWTSQDPRWKGREKPVGAADRNPDRFVTYFASDYIHDITVARRAFQSHLGPKALLKYEDLRTDPTEVLIRTCAELRLQLRTGNIVQAVQGHVWENIPKEQRGPGRFYRKAKPGGWREDLTHEQVRIVEEAAGPIIEEFYPASSYVV
jgi:Sulfotransferase domain